MWFIFSLITIFAWGFADLFYKIGTDEDDNQSHFKIAIHVGLVMGIFSIILIPFSESSYIIKNLPMNFIKYLPSSLSYIISMVIGYAGLRYIELSIISPVQNTSGAFSMIILIIYFLFTNKNKNFFSEFSILEILATLIIVIGLIFLAIIENNKSKTIVKNNKYKYGAMALIFPILYAFFDAIGTTFDGIILSENNILNLGEIDVLVIYGFTFFLVGVILFFYISIKNKKIYNIFSKSERPKICASLFEEFGQIFYIFAMAIRPIIVAPLVASYFIVSIILSHIVLKEKLDLSHYIVTTIVIIGIALLGIVNV